MASWLIGAPGETGNSRMHRQFMKERVEAKPAPSAVPPARTTIEMIASPMIPATTSATKTRLNKSAIKSYINTI